MGTLKILVRGVFGASLLLAAPFASPLSAAEDDPLVAVVASEPLRASGVVDVVTASLEGPVADRLVDRTQLARLATELNLAGLFDATSVSRRQALARLAGADMLVLLQEVENVDVEFAEEKRPLRMVMVDCRYGIRLVDRTFEQTPNALTADLPRLLEQTYARRSAGVSQIVGFTPLVAEGEQGHIESLQIGLPRLLERSLAPRSGVVAMSADEAVQIGKERLLGTIPNTTVPITIVSGRYTVRFSDDRTNEVAVSLEAVSDSGQRQTLAFAVEEDDYANVVLPPERIDQIMAFLDDVLELKPDVSGASGWEARTEIARSMAEEARRQAQAGGLEEVLSIGEAALLIDPLRCDVRLMLIGAYRRRLQQGLRKPQFVETGGKRRFVRPAAVLENRIYAHGEYLFRNALLNKADASALLHVMFEQLRSHQHNARTNVDGVYEFRDRTLDWLALVAPLPEMSPSDVDVRLRNYAIGQTSHAWETTPREAGAVTDVGYWTRTAIELKDAIHCRADRFAERLEHERQRLNDWAIQYEESIARREMSPEE